MSNFDLGPEFLARLRDAIDIVDLISDHVRLKHKGRSWEGLCPFHEEKTPSFSVDPVKGLYYCFGCHQGGDAFKFLMAMEHLSFPEAAEQLARRFGVPLPARDPNAQRKRKESERQRALLEEAQSFFVRALSLPEAEPARRELARRDFQESSWKEYGFGWAPDGWRELLDAMSRRHPEGSIVSTGLAIQPESGKKAYDRFRNRLMFPIKGSDGRIIAFGGRILGEGEPKYLNSPEGPLFHKRSTLFHLHRARKAIASKGRVLVVEGYFDCLSLHHSGIEECVATLGTALTADHARILRRLLGDDGTAILCYDADKAGRRAARAGAQVLLQAGIETRILSLEEGKDPDDIVRRDGAGAFQGMIDGAQSLLEYLFEGLPPDPALRRKEGLHLAPIVCSAANPAIRQNLVEELARRLNLRPRDIENSGRSAPRMPPAPPDTMKTDRLPHPPPGEMDIIRILLSGPDELRDRICAEVREEILSDSRTREILRIALDNEGDPTTAILEQSRDEGTHALIAEISLSVPSSEADDQGTKTLEEILTRQRTLEARKLQAAIEEAAERGDFETLAELQKRKMELRGRS